MYHLDLSTIWPHVNQGLYTILLVLAAWLVWEARVWLSAHAKFLSVSTRQKIATELNSLLNDAINYAMSVASAQEKKVQPTTDSFITKTAAQFVIDHSGGEIDKSADQLKQLIIAKLPPVPTTEDTTGAKIPNPPRVIIKPLSPIS